MGSIATGLGNIGESVGLAQESQREDALKKLYAQIQQQYASQSQRRLQMEEQDRGLKTKLETAPQVVHSYRGIDGKVHSIIRDPTTGKLTEQIGGEEGSTVDEKVAAFRQLYKREPDDQEKAQLLGIQPKETLGIKWDEAMLIARRSGYTGQKAIEFARSMMPGGAAVNKLVFPGMGKPGGNDSETLSPIDERYARLLATGGMNQDQFDKVYTGKAGDAKRAAVVDRAIQLGFNPNAQLTPEAQKRLEDMKPVQDQIGRLLDHINSLKLGNNNTMGYLAVQRGLYKLGHASPAGTLGEDIAGLSLGSLVEAASVLKGVSRSVPALLIALDHTPNAWTDSPKLIKEKLQTINDRLNDVISEAQTYGTKSGLPNKQMGKKKVGEDVTLRSGKRARITSINSDGSYQAKEY